MIQHLRPAFVLLVLFTLLTGIVYPLAVTGVAAVALPQHAGQNFVSEHYFQPRPSATSAPDPKDASKTIDAPYNAGNSGGSNLGPTSQALVDRVKAAVAAKREAGWQGALPADALTTSASGLDPEISPQNAFAQVPSVAKARGLQEAKVRDLVAAHVEGRLFGVLGEPRVNVLMVNLALDALK